MKRILFALFVSLVFFSSSAYAVNIGSIDIVVQLGEPVHEIITIDYQDFVDKADYFIMAELSNVKVYAGDLLKELDCELKTYSLGTEILCRDIWENHVVFEFDAYGLLQKKNSLLIFSYPFPVTEMIDNLTLTVKLPLGAVLPDLDELPPGFVRYRPETGQEGSDGRNIFVKWVFEKPELGKDINVSVIYETFGTQNPVFMLVIFFVIILGGFVFLFRRKSRVQMILPVLTEDERKVVKILLRSDKKLVDQRQFVKELDYSKSKVSRILQDLEKRGLITRIRFGRTNKVKIVDKMKKPGK